MSKRNLKKTDAVLLIGLAILIIILGSVYALKTGEQGSKGATNQQADVVADTTGWKAYTDTQTGLKVLYPANWTVDINPKLGIPNMVFCPPELTDTFGTCKSESIAGNKVESLAPIKLFIQHFGDSAPPMSYDGGTKIGTRNSYYGLTSSNDSKYSSVYSAMKQSVTIVK